MLINTFNFFFIFKFWAGTEAPLYFCVWKLKDGVADGFNELDFSVTLKLPFVDFPPSLCNLSFRYESPTASF